MSSRSTLSREDHHFFPIESIDLPAESECFREMRLLLERERSRAEMTGGRLSLVVFTLNAGEGEYTFAAHVVWTILARIDRRDEVGWFDDRHIGLVLPGISPERAAAIAGEIHAALPPEIRLEWTVFGYPRLWLEDVSEYPRTAGIYSGPPSDNRRVPEREVRLRVIRMKSLGWERENVAAAGRYHRSGGSGR